jgi:2-haloacid dehalogenase
MRLRVAVFDLYGTLVDVAAAARTVASADAELAQQADALSRLWRDKQLGYTWLRTIAGRHEDFAKVTGDALDWALTRLGLTDPGRRTRLMDAYLRLPAHPDANIALEAAGEAGLSRAILSNGTPAMISAGVAHAGLSRHFEALLSVEGVGAFKPLSKVYDLVGQRFGTQPGEVLFVTANGWDAAGAAGYGFRTVWVNRAGDPVDALWARPAFVLPDLSRLAEAF